MPLSDTLPVHAVLVDIDDTLLDTTAAMHAAGRSAMAAVWPAQPPDWHVEAGMRFRRDPGGYFHRYISGELDFMQMRSRRLAEVAEHYQMELPAGAAELFEGTFRPHFLQHQLRYDDVLPFLAACRTAGLVVGALTNASAAVTEPKLAANELADSFTVVVTRDTLGFGKPDPQVFRQACKQLGSEPAETAYIGDEWAADIEGSRGAGLHPIWIQRGATCPLLKAEDVPVITSLDQLRPGDGLLELLDLGAARSTG